MPNLAQLAAGAQSAHPDTTLAEDTERLMEEDKHEDAVAPVRVPSKEDIDSQVDFA